MGVIIFFKTVQILIMKKTLYLFPFFLSLVTVSFADLSAIEATVTKARVYVGTEEALAALESIQYRGKVTYYGEEEEIGEAIISFKKPGSQRVEFIFPNRRHVSGFNGYEGYEFVEREDEFGVPAKDMRVVKGVELRLNKFASIENIYYYRPFELTEANTVDHGIVTINGIETHCIDFIHHDRYVFKRYFDTATGDLVQSVVGTGLVVTEEGDFEVDGLRFSKAITGKLNGENIYKIAYEEIIVNPELPSDFFAFPVD
jgi:hypothetical protein